MSLIPFALTALVVVGLDQLTKHLVVSKLGEGDVIHVIDNVLTLHLTLNSGGAFGIGRGLPGFFLAASIAVVALVIVLARRIDDPRWLIPLGLVLGGGLGNLVDRVFRSTEGRVVDFIDLQVWPVFNVADSAIVIGVLTLFWFSFRTPRTES